MPSNRRRNNQKLKLKQKVPPENEEEFLYPEGAKAREQVPREGVESPALETFQSHLDTFL